ncbi:histidine kinase [Pedobacter sp.]|uniref:sensor histidine kinase n=1 Tax=Pedobacter sp. TaxID=1411316 RepID=UPI0031D0B13B
MINKKTFRIHALVWSLFIIWETVITNLLYDMSAPVINYFVHYGITIALFYFQSNTVLPWLGKRKGQWLWIPLFCILFLLTYIVAHWAGEIFLTHLLDKPIKPLYGMTWQSFLRNGYRGMFFIGFSTGYYYLYSFIAQRRHAQELEKQQLLAIIGQQQTQRELDLMQTAFLKAQINPHFLFNILNYIHFQSMKSAPQISEAVTRLANVMRFAFDIGHTDETVKLGEELAQIEDVIYLYSLRKNTGTLELDYELAVCNLYLIPLGLLTLAENCFKHGDLSESNARMQLSLEDGQLQISTWNKIAAEKPTISTHTGLQNLSKRLQATYGQNHHFSYGPDGNGGFSVQLQIALELTLQPVSSAITNTGTTVLP